MFCLFIVNVVKEYYTKRILYRFEKRRNKIFLCKYIYYNIILKSIFTLFILYLK